MIRTPAAEAGPASIWLVTPYVYEFVFLLIVSSGWTFYLASTTNPFVTIYNVGLYPEGNWTESCMPVLKFKKGSLLLNVDKTNVIAMELTHV